MRLQTIGALVGVELKKLYRDPMNLVVMLLMPVGLALVFYFALSGITNDYYPVPGMNHFEYLLPGVMGYAVIYMGMMVALALVEYRESGLLKRIQVTPVSPFAYLASHIIANVIIATFQAFIVLLVARVLGFHPQGGLVGLLLAALFLALLAITAVGLGLLTASLAKSSGAASGISTIFILPMMMFGALLAVFDETTRQIARFTPNFYVSDSLSIIFHTGRISDPAIWQNLLILAAISLVTAVVGMQAFKRTALTAMTAGDVEPTTQTAAAAVAQERTRLFYIDHLRAGLAALVVVHHVALVYGATVEGFYYLEPPFTDPLAYLTLMIFVLVNQSWFMGAFFLLAGLFTPASFDRKGPGAFLKSRLIRLGIPLLVFYFVLSPIARVGWWLMPSSLTGLTTPLTWQAYPAMVGIGPLWFVAMLLIFSFGYAGWRWLTSNREASPPGPSAGLTYLGLSVFVLALAGAGYLMRMVVPLGKSVLEFPTLAYLPQYLSFYVIGILVARKDWLAKLTDRMGWMGLAAAVAALLLLFPLAFSGQWFSLALTPSLDLAMGNGHWRSAVYALWDSIFAVGLCLGLITLFRRFANGSSRPGSWLSRNSYAVYIIHIPILVYAVYLLRDIKTTALLKFGLASLIILPLCFIAAALIRKVPGVQRVL